MRRNPNCKAYRTGSQIICPQCGLNWDAADTEPPDCRIDETPRPKQPKPQRRWRRDRHSIGGSL